MILSKVMENWLQEQEEDDVDGYLDVDIYIKEWIEKIKELEDDANILQCLRDAGIDNVEVYSQGMHIYYERYPEKDE